MSRIFFQLKTVDCECILRKRLIEVSSFGYKSRIREVKTVEVEFFVDTLERLWFTSSLCRLPYILLMDSKITHHDNIVFGLNSGKTSLLKYNLATGSTVWQSTRLMNCSAGKPPKTYTFHVL